VRVAIVDDSSLFREGLSALLHSAGVDVIVQAPDGTSLLTALQDSEPDIVILDIRMPPTFTDEGLATAQAVRQSYPDIGLLLLSTYAETAYAVQVLDIGERAIGYLLKDRVRDVRTLLDALDRIVSGEAVIDPDIIQRLLRRQRASSVLDRLPPRERQVLQLMAEGRSNWGISQELSLQTKTIEHYIASLFAHLGLDDSTEDNRRVLATLTYLRSAT
jgi:DNA-binding NarL/FixJ family response regulator